MADSAKSAVQLLDELRKEREDLDGLIQALEKRLGIGASQPISASAEVSERSGVPVPASLPVGFFHNLSQAAAAEKLLRLHATPMTTGNILEAFRNSGMKLNPVNATTILYTALKRSPIFERVGNKAWGLKEWYPERKKRASKDQGAESKSESSEV
jgi:hypothetical protein